MAGALFGAAESRAEAARPDARDSAAIQSCIKSARGDATAAERCIDSIADPCLKQPAANSTAGQVACVDRELAVWDDILNETFRRLRDKLDEEQKIKLRDMQRAWIEFARQDLRILLGLPPGYDRGSDGGVLPNARDRAPGIVSAKLPQ